MEVKCTLINGVSKKSGKPFTALEVQLTENLKKMIFLDPAELEVLKLQGKIKEEKAEDDNDFPDFR